MNLKSKKKKMLTPEKFHVSVAVGVVDRDRDGNVDRETTATATAMPRPRLRLWKYYLFLFLKSFLLEYLTRFLSINFLQEIAQVWGQFFFSGAFLEN